MLLLRLVVDAFGEAILEDLPDGQGATLLNIYAIGLMLLSTLDLGPVDVLFEGDGGVDTGTQTPGALPSLADPAIVWRDGHRLNAGSSHVEGGLQADERREQLRAKG
jgi:hypothetical protein